MDFVTVPGGEYELGWRYADLLTPEMISAIETLLPLDDLLSSFSAQRRVTLAPFEIARESVGFTDLLGEPYDLEITTLDDACALLDARLRDDGWRLPSEDELEAACGGSLFAWGTQVPDGQPYGTETTFTQHRDLNAFGMQLNHNPYSPELARCAFMLGDGGAALCGGEPWPMAWVSLCPSFRLSGPAVEDGLLETLGMARVRPVRLAAAR